MTTVPNLNIYLSRDGVQAGPFNETTLTSMLHTGVVRWDDLAWKEGMSEWTALSKFPRQDHPTNVASPQCVAAAPAEKYTHTSDAFQDPMPITKENQRSHQVADRLEVTICARVDVKEVVSNLRGCEPAEQTLQHPVESSGLACGLISLGKHLFSTLQSQKGIVAVLLLLFGLWGFNKFIPRFWVDSEPETSNQPTIPRVVDTAHVPPRSFITASTITSPPISSRGEESLLVPALPQDLQILKPLTGIEICEHLFAVAEERMWQKMQHIFSSTNIVTISENAKKSGATVIEDPRLIGFRKALASKDLTLLTRSIGAYWLPIREQTSIVGDAENVVAVLQEYSNGDLREKTPEATIQFIRKMIQSLEAKITNCAEKILNDSRLCHFEISLDATRIDVLKYRPHQIVIEPLPSDQSLLGQTDLILSDHFKFDDNTDIEYQRKFNATAPQRDRVCSASLDQRILIFGRVQVEKISRYVPSSPDGMMSPEDKEEFQQSLREYKSKNYDDQALGAYLKDFWFDAPNRFLLSLLKPYDEKIRRLKDDYQNGSLSREQYLNAAKTAIAAAEETVKEDFLKY